MDTDLTPPFNVLSYGCQNSGKKALEKEAAAKEASEKEITGK